MVSLILLILLFSFIQFVERKVLKLGKYTPITLLVGPLLVLILIVYLTAGYTKFITPDNKALSIIIYGTLSFWLGGFFVSLFLKPVLKKDFSNFQMGFVPIKSMYITAAIFVGIMLVSLRSMLGSRSILAVEKTEFAINGIDAHIGGIIMGYLIFFIVVLWEKKIKINKYLVFFFIGSIFLIKMASGVRGNVILPFLGALIYLLTKEYIKITPKMLFLSFVGITAIFMLPTLIFLKDASTDYLISYFIFYATAGVLGLSGYFEQAYPVVEIDLNIIFSFFINLKVKIFGSGEFINLVSPVFVPVTSGRADYFFASNVYTFLGEVYIYGGYLIGSIYLFAFGVYSYILFYMRNVSMLLLLLYVFVGACLVLGIFSSYAFNPYFYEIQILFILLHLLSKRKIIS